MIGIISLILILIGFYGLITNRHILKMIVAMNILEIGVNIFIVSLGYKEGAVAPILTSVHQSNTLSFVDPLPQALVLTAIVIGVGSTALALAFARKIYAKYGTYQLDEIKEVA